MKKHIMVFSIALSVLVGSCSMLKQVAAPGISRGMASTAEYVLKLKSNELIYNIELEPGISCPQAFLIITAELINPTNDTLVIKPEDFKLKLLESDTTLTPIHRDQFCSKLYGVDCEAAAEGLKDLGIENEYSLQELMLITEAEVAECKLAKLPSIIEGEMKIAPRSRVTLELVFSDDSFSEKFLSNQKFFLRFRNLPDFVLVGSEYN
jgi:hypothetical protein